MPEPNAVPQPSTNDALDMSFSQLFGGGNDVNLQPTTAPSTDPNPQPSPVVAQPPQVAPQPPLQPQGDPQPQQPSVQQQFELKTKTGTVYKSVDDAVKGIEHKDALISQLRRTVIEATGVDPLTGQPIEQDPMAQFQNQFGQPQIPGMQPQQQQPETSYLQDPQKYFQDLYAAYQSNDPQKYFAVQQRLIEEKTQAQFAPVVPVIQNFVKQGAVDAVSNELPEFRKFYGSQAWNETLQAYPTLAIGIANAQQNFQLANQLPDLYKVVYTLHQAKTLPDLLRQQPPVANPQQPVRPTATPSTQAPPPAPSFSQNTNLTDDSARKAVIEAFEKSGRADARWK